MAKQGKEALQAALQGRSPLAQRQAILPVNILDEALHPTGISNEESERQKRSEDSNDKSERIDRVEEANAKSVRQTRTFKASSKPVRYSRTEKASNKTERRKRTILMEPEKPETIRDSYEAYVAQLEEMDRLRDLYRQKTGRPLSKSRIIREALASFLPVAIKAFKGDEKDE